MIMEVTAHNTEEECGTPSSSSFFSPPLPTAQGAPPFDFLGLACGEPHGLPLGVHTGVQPGVRIICAA